jgi:Secreted repeat of unknown function
MHVIPTSRLSALVSHSHHNSFHHLTRRAMMPSNSDTPTSVCSGGCASAWPPVLSTSMPSVSTKLPGTFSLLNDANGSQVTYNGHPLYTYSGDSAPGQANGQGFGNIWFVVPTTLPAKTTPSGSTPTPGGYSRQPHFLTTGWRQERRMLSCI